MKAFTITVVLVVLGSIQALPSGNEGRNPLALISGESSSPFTDQVLQDVLTSIRNSGAQTEAFARQARAKVQDVVNQLQRAVTLVQPALQQVGSVVSGTSLPLLTAALGNYSTAVSSCVWSKAGDLRNVTVGSGAEIIACFTNKIKEAQAILKEVMLLGEEAVAIVPNGLAGVRACPALTLQQILARLMCLVDEAGKATAQSAKIVAGLTTNVAKAMTLAATAQSDIERCIVGSLVSFLLRTAQVAANMGLCVVTAL